MRTFPTIIGLLLFAATFLLNACAEDKRDIRINRARISLELSIPSGSAVPDYKVEIASDCTQKAFYYTCPLKCSHSHLQKPGRCSACGSNLTFISTQKPSPAHDLHLTSASH